MTRPTAVAQTGVVLCNLGTPAAASTPAVRSWLTEMLTDRRIVDLPPLLWKPILYGAILRRRPAPVAEKYAAIWDSAPRCFAASLSDPMLERRSAAATCADGSVGAGCNRYALWRTFCGDCLGRLGRAGM